MLRRLWRQTIDQKITESLRTDAQPIIVSPPQAKEEVLHARSYNSNNYLHRLCCKLGIDDKIYAICQEICDKVDKEKILDKHNPLSRTTTVIYYVVLKYSLPLSKQQIADACKVSEVTINKCYVKMQHYFGEKL